MYKEIRLSGTGGQGLILAGIILAEAAGVYDGYNVIQTQSYGPEARGGASRAEVIISDSVIDYPKVTSPDIVLIMSEQACDKYGNQVKTGGIVLLDDTNVDSRPVLDGASIIALPITEIARHGVGRQVVANVVALGALVGVSKVVTPEALEKAVLSRVPKGTEDLNMKAFHMGLERGRRAMTEHETP